MAWRTQAIRTALGVGAVLAATVVAPSASASESGTTIYLLSRSENYFEQCAPAEPCQPSHEARNGEPVTFEVPARGRAEIVYHRTDPSSRDNTDYLQNDCAPGGFIHQTREEFRFSFTVYVVDSAGQRTEVYDTKRIGGATTWDNRVTIVEFGYWNNSSACAPRLVNHVSWERFNVWLSDSPNYGGDVDCGVFGSMRAEDADAVVQRGLARGGNPCDVAVDMGSVRSDSDSAMSSSMRAEGGAITLGDGSRWEVLSEQIVSDPHSARESRCLDLRGKAHVLAGDGSSPAEITIDQTVCKSFNPATLRYEVTNGQSEAAPGTELWGRWLPPGKPQVSVTSNDWLFGFTNGGLGGSGVSSADRVPHSNSNNAAWLVQVQTIMYLGLGLPQPAGGFVGWQKSLQKSYQVTVDDIANP